MKPAKEHSRQIQNQGLTRDLGACRGTLIDALHRGAEIIRLEKR